MFNSQKINNDPEPWRGFSLMRYEASEGQSNYAGWEPRPEYDNNPNEILIAFREDTYAKGTVKEAKSIHKYWELYLEVLRGQGYKVTEDTKDHARKVLTKLVNVYGNNVGSTRRGQHYLQERPEPPFEPYWGMVIGEQKAHKYDGAGVKAVYIPTGDNYPWFSHPEPGSRYYYYSEDWAKQKLAEGWVVIEKPEGVK